MKARVPALIVHGGAGLERPDGRDEAREGIRGALGAAWPALAAGGSALDAVEAAVRAMEDDPSFNAGRGSVLTAAGTVETDASIMNGDTLDNGAVACVSGVRHPVTLARRIMESGRHSFFAGAGALERARALGVELCDPAELGVERRPPPRTGMPTGTVGAVAIDRAGSIAAATSTGGISGKLPGRVGDSPLIGCGTYAETTLGGVSCTGEGEAIIRVVLARRALEILRTVDDPQRAADIAVSVLAEEGRGHGGLIIVDWKGRLGWAHSTPLMAVGFRSAAAAGPVLAF